MCRWVLYKGDRIKIADVVTRPAHSLVDQAKNPDVFTPGVESSALYDREQRKHRDHSINVDGFGLAWYTMDKKAVTPTLIKSLLPPWSSATLSEIAESTDTQLLFAHIRAASPGLRVSEANCHPFRCGRFLFMHNGGVAGFSKIKQRLRTTLRPDILSGIEGTTDSEHIFAVFMNMFPDQGINGPFNRYVDKKNVCRGPYSATEIVYALQRTVSKVRQLQKQCGLTFEESHSSLNLAVTDGHTVVALRCRTHPKQDPPSLYYSFGEDFGTLKTAKREMSIRKLSKRVSVSANGTAWTFLGRSESVEGNTNDTLLVASEPPEYIKVCQEEDASPTSVGYRLIPKDTMVVGHGTKDGGVGKVELIKLQLKEWKDIEVIGVGLTEDGSINKTGQDLTTSTVIGSGSGSSSSMSNRRDLVFGLVIGVVLTVLVGNVQRR
jgi:glutamine amidotransferase